MVVYNHMSDQQKTFLDLERLAAVDEQAFQRQKPYPWVNPAGLVRSEMLEILLADEPDLSLYAVDFGKQRAYGQQSHDRYELQLQDDTPLPQVWRDFIEELQGPDYRHFLERLFDRKDFTIRFQWHAAIRGCSVSPHCDSPKKIGSHLFYLNTEKDWRPEWGGQTIVLDDGGKLSQFTAPSFEDFAGQTVSKAMVPYSFIFSQTEHSWHAVKELTCPEGASRRVFMVILEKRDTVWVRVRQAIRNLFS